MKKQALLISIILLFSQQIFAASHSKAVARLKYSVDFVLDYVLAKKKLKKDPSLAMPELLMSSTTPVEVFQTAIKDQWGFMPDAITNAYSVKTNTIFLYDDKTYYDQVKRCIDDSLAHELTHYVQVMYQKWDLADESLEWDAVDIQAQFREEFCSEHANSTISKKRH